MTLPACGLAVSLDGLSGAASDRDGGDDVATSAPTATSDGERDRDDASTPLDDATLPPGSAPGATRCTVDAPFGAPRALGGLEAYSVEGVRFALSQVFLSLCPPDGAKDACDLYQGAITAPDTFGAFAKIPVSAPSSYDSYASPTRDAKRLIFGSSRQNTVSIFVSEAEGGQFLGAAPLALGFASAPLSANEPYLSPDGQHLFFGAQLTAGTTWDLYRAERDGGSGFRNPARLSVSTEAAHELAPVPSEDELEIFWASLGASSSPSTMDLWMASRLSTSVAFGNARRMQALSGAEEDFPTSLSPDACHLYFISKKSGRATAYVASRR